MCEHFSCMLNKAWAMNAFKSMNSFVTLSDMLKKVLVRYRDSFLAQLSYS
jgi:hypothetical protein